MLNLLLSWVKALFKRSSYQNYPMGKPELVLSRERKKLLQVQAVLSKLEFSLLQSRTALSESHLAWEAESCLHSSRYVQLGSVCRTTWGVTAFNAELGTEKISVEQSHGGGILEIILCCRKPSALLFGCGGETDMSTSCFTELPFMSSRVQQASLNCVVIT